MTSVMTANIDDSVPTEEEVEWAVRRIRGNRSSGPSRMRTKHLREWLREHTLGEVAREAAMKKEDSDPEGQERRGEDRGEDGEEELEKTK